MATVLREMTVGEAGRVLGFGEGSAAYRRKLLAMGLTRGATFKISRIAPLGDPVEIVLRGFSLSLRRAEADVVLVERAAETAA